MHADDVDFIDNPLKISRRYDKFEVDILVKDGDVLDLCGEKIKVAHTPGHSLGGVCYVLDNVILRRYDIQRELRTELTVRGGDFGELYKSVKKFWICRAIIFCLADTARYYKRI